MLASASSMSMNGSLVVDDSSPVVGPAVVSPLVDPDDPSLDDPSTVVGPAVDPDELSPPVVGSCVTVVSPDVPGVPLVSASVPPAESPQPATTDTHTPRTERRCNIARTLLQPPPG